MLSIAGKSKAIGERKNGLQALPPLPNRIGTLRAEKSREKHARTTASRSALLPVASAVLTVSTRPESMLLVSSSNFQSSMTTPSVKDIAIARLNGPAEEVGYVTVKFNIYNKSFKVYNGVLRWADVDEEYSFSFVYRGNYKRDLKVVPNFCDDSEMTTVSHDISRNSSEFNSHDGFVARDDDGEYFIGLSPGMQLVAFVDEDPVAGIGADGLRIRTGPIKSCSEDGQLISSTRPSGNNAVQRLTKELMAMDASQLKGAHAANIREERDVEDVLFSGY